MKTIELKSYLEKERLDLSIFYNLSSLETSPNFFYFTGYEGLGALVTPKIKVPLLLAPKMEFERAKKSKIKNIVLWDKKRLFETVKEVLKKNKINAKKIGIDYSTFTLEAFKGLKKTFKGAKFADIGNICRKLRLVKTKEEILSIKKGCAVADGIFKDAIRNFKNFKTESDVSSFLEYKIKKQGLDISFKPIVASGKNSSMPHYVPQNKPLQKGFCVIDFGVKYKGYCTDMTRTIYLGTPDKKEIQIYDLLLEIQKSAIASVNPEVECGLIYSNVIKWLGKYSKYFIHGLGHGVGIEIHEAPNLKPESKDKLENNIPFTIEPGIYFPGKFGIRIEDTVVLINGKIKVLTNSSKELAIIS